MATVHEIGPYYWHTMRLPVRGPLIDHDMTYEIDEPYRIGVATLLRIPFTGRRIVVGHWIAEQDSDHAWLSAVQGREITLREALSDR